MPERINLEKLLNSILFMLKSKYTDNSQELLYLLESALKEQGFVYKDDNIVKTSNIVNIAENEKYDFVSGQFLYCKSSFNKFEERKFYWLEYIGNDTYIGRSDNILNQKFFITPKQLYTNFGTKESACVIK